MEADVRDVRLFAPWFEEAYGELFAPSLVIPRGIADFKGLPPPRKVPLSGVNRGLAALSCSFDWALSRGYVRADPTEGIKGLGKRLRPRALPPQELRRFLRAVFAALAGACFQRGKWQDNVAG